MSLRELFVLSLIDLAPVFFVAEVTVLRVLTLLLLWCWFELLLLSLLWWTALWTVSEVRSVCLPAIFSTVCRSLRIGLLRSPLSLVPVVVENVHFLLRFVLRLPVVVLFFLPCFHFGPLGLLSAWGALYPG